MTNVSRDLPQSASMAPRYHNYVPALVVPAASDLLFTSGLNGFMPDGITIAPDFTTQAENAWRQLEQILDEAGMSISDVVLLRFYLASAADDSANVEVLRRHLGSHSAARTVVVQQMLDPRWLIELEAVAARSPGGQEQPEH